ncbi:KAP-like P-loop domain-containing protein [Cytobacillus oceanisediminis]|uniref:KAP-like P-loop domain-containing protein n=1 Tax=Cytobacillus oceanisediminis TaxID=665099 RepID=A0A2V2ZTF0_9BACI|nr:P-loop NTPase fold protein [Cytobacillus oceanisediminis]PWW26609.1 KAP-like P-loop domain-containing protein [Cytobacillus oceanisediminis]
MKYIVDSIINYVKKENTNYAILLNGKWGSGKTFFWENDIKPAIESTLINDRQQKTNYISLYGISSLEEINKRIVLNELITKNQKVQELADSKWGGRVTELAKMGLGLVKNLDIPVLKEVLETSVNYENLLDFTDTVLCFDDLERANIDITDILGYINNFVEHDGAKVIIIGYEDEIAEKLIHRNLEMKMLVSSVVLDKEGGFSQNQIQQRGSSSVQQVSSSELINDKMNSLFHRSNEYKRIKEKLIGKTLTLEPNTNELIDSIVNRVVDEDLKEFLTKNQESIVRVFKDSGTENIRILKQALDDFELIYLRYKEEYNELGVEVLLSILVYTLAVSFEIKSEQEGNKDLELATSDTLFLISFSKMNKDHKESYIESFIKKYSLGTTNPQQIVFFPFVERLVRRGILDLEQFEGEMQVIRAKMGQDTPLYIRLLKDGFYYLTNEEFAQAVPQAYEKLSKGEVPFVLYFNAFNLFRYFIEKGLIQEDLVEVKKVLLDGLNIAAERSEYYPNMDTFFIGTKIEPKDEDLLEFKEKIISINKVLQTKSEERQIQELMTYLETDFTKFLREMRERYYYVPVFNKYSVDDLFNKIITLSNPDTNTFLILLEKRYENIGENLQFKLYLEKEPLKDLKTKIESFIHEKEVTLKVSLLKELIQTIDKMLDILEESKPKEDTSNT